MVVFKLGFGFFMFAFSGVCFAEGLTAETVLENNAGARALTEGHVSAAQEKLLKGLEGAPQRPEIYLNLGLSYESGEEAEKAVKSYETVLDLTKHPEMRFYALFNSARLAGEAKQIDRALELYQSALEYKPDSVEVKTNIELLIQQQQQGGGKGKDDQKKKDDKGDQNKKDQDKEGDKDKKKKYAKNPKPKPKEFKSEKLDKKDVRRIFEELKQQEQKIRAEYFRKGKKDKSHGKDW